MPAESSRLARVWWALASSGLLHLVRIDTKTHASERVGTLNHLLAFVGFTVYWRDVTSYPGADTVVRRDSVTGEVKERIRVGRVSGPLAAGGGAVWAAIIQGAVRATTSRPTGSRRSTSAARPKTWSSLGTVWVAVTEPDERADEPAAPEELEPPA